MGNRIVILLFLLTALLTASALALIAVQRGRGQAEEHRRLRWAGLAAFGALFASALYFLSFFDVVSEQTERYDPVLRGLDIFTGYVSNFSWLLYMQEEWKAGEGKFHPSCRAVRIWLTAAFAGAEICYLALIDDAYRAVSPSALLPASLLQSILMASIILAAVMQAVLLRRSELRRGIRWTVLDTLVLTETILVSMMAVYNGLTSLQLFRGSYNYQAWTGSADLNTYLLCASAAVCLGIVIYYYRLSLQRAAEAEPAAPGLPSEEELRQRCGLTPRESEIARLILQRETYEEIADQLNISKYTVKRHVHNIYEKTGVSRREELIHKLKS